MRFILIALLSLASVSCNKEKESTSFFNSDKTIQVNFGLGLNNNPYYKVYYNKEIVLDSSELGIIREDADFSKNLEIIDISEGEKISDSYSMLQGKQKDITYKAEKYEIHLKNKKGDLMDIVFQISDDGIAFRYNFPEKSSKIKKITEEKTSYNFVDDTKAWLQPMSKAKSGWSETNPSYEEPYVTNVSLNTESDIGEGWVYPALFKSDGTWILISESGLHRKYAGTHLIKQKDNTTLQVGFPQKEEIFPGGALNPESTLPWATPWRTITIGSLKTITESTMGTDLATPSKLEKTDYIESGLASWSWVLLKDESVNYETTKKFIDYASQMEWKYCLIDADWDRKIGYDKVKQLVDYAKEKNVKILVWYNSAGSWNTTPYTPKSKLLTAEDREKEFSKLKEIGVAGIKVDFFGGDGQSMISYYHDILEAAGKFNIVVNFHGATLPRGWQRTYPNLLTVEAIKGYEFITFSQETADLAPGHIAMLPFTRNVFDPMDFTPMVLDSIPGIKRKTTPSFELALPVLFLSGIQHIAEIPEGMAKQPDYVINYLKDIPTNWDESRFLSGFPGKDIVMARRKDDTWHIIGINGENISKEVEIDLRFFEKNREGFLITDGNSGFSKTNVSAKENSTIKITMKPYGGFVMTF